MDMQFQCVIEKGFSWRGKKEFFPYSVLQMQFEWNIEREPYLECYKYFCSHLRWLSYM